LALGSINTSLWGKYPKNQKKIAEIFKIFIFLHPQLGEEFQSSRVPEFQSSRFKVPEFQVQGSRFQSSRFQVAGSRFKVQGSRFKVVGC
jgi:hypothetical protein